MTSAPLASDPVMELHHLILIMLEGHGGQVNRERERVILKYSVFCSQCISNAQILFSEKLSSKKRGQISSDKRGYQEALLASLATNSPEISKSSHTCEKNIFYILKGTACFQHNIMVFIWCFIPEN